MAVTDPGTFRLGVAPLGAKPPGASPTEAAFAQFASFLTSIRTWCTHRADRVAEAYLVIGTGDVALYVVGKEKIYDFVLSRELSELCVALNEQDWPIGTTLIPACEPEELTAFFDASDAEYL